MTSQIQSIPDLNLHQQSQIQELYNQQKFVQLIHILDQKSILYYCPYDQITIRNFFNQICIRQNTQQLTLDIVHQFISQLKQNNRNQLAKENDYYRIYMQQNLNKGIQTISKKQFRKILQRYDGNMPVITQILIQNSKEADYISCQLVLDLLQQVQIQIEDAIIPQLSITKLKTLRLRTNQQIFEENNSNSKINIPIFSQIQQYQIKKLIDQYSRDFHRKLRFYQEFIGDQEVLQDIEQYLSNLVEIENNIGDSINQMIDTNNKLRNQCEDHNKILITYSQEDINRNEIIDKLRQQIQKLKQQTNDLQAKNIRLQIISQKLQQFAKQSQNELLKINKQYQQLQLQFKQTKQNYQLIYKQYYKLIQITENKQIILKQQQSKKIFINRTLKQQLQDKTYKLNKLINQKQKQKKINQENQLNYSNQIFLLEIKLDQLEKQLKQKNQYLHSYIRQSNINMRQSSFKMSKIQSKFKQQRISNSPQKLQSNIPQQRKSRISQIIIDRQSQIFKKTNKIKIGVIEPIIEVDEINEKQQNIFQLIKEDNINFQEKGFKKLKITQLSNTNQYFNKQQIFNNYQYFYSKGLIINAHGIKYQTIILLTKKRLCCLDNKLKLQKYLPLQHIKEIIFNLQNPCLLVVKVRQPKRLDSEIHFTHDMIFSSRKLDYLQRMLSTMRSKKEILFNVTMKKSQQIWIKFHEKQQNMKHSIPNTQNPYRMSLANHFVFYVQLKKLNSFIPTKINAILIIQSCGVFCFEGDEIDQLDQKRQFLYFIPFSEDITFKLKIESKQAPQKKIAIQYQYLDTVYQIIFNSKNDRYNFKKAVDSQIQKNKKILQENNKKFIKYFPNS